MACALTLAATAPLAVTQVDLAGDASGEADLDELIDALIAAEAQAAGRQVKLLLLTLGVLSVIVVVAVAAAVHRRAVLPPAVPRRTADAPLPAADAATD